MTRVANLPESEVTRRIATLTQSITELKTSQFAGSANVITQRYASGLDSDLAASVVYQVTTAYEVTISASDTTFANNPFVWHSFFTVVGIPASTGFLTATEADPPGDGVLKMRQYFFGADPAHTPQTVNFQIVLYGLNIGGFSISRII